MFYYLIFIFLVIKKCESILYSVNDTEYERMPRLFELDHYESCLKQSNSQYCLVRLELFAEPTNDLITLIKEYSEHTTKHYNHSYLQKGICVTKTCKRYINDSTFHNITASIEACVNHSIWKEYGLQAKLMNIYYCDKHNQHIVSDYTDWIFGSLLLVLLALNIIGSIYDFKNQTDNTKQKETSYLVCFSIFQSWKTMMVPSVKDPRLNALKGLHGIRALLSFLMPIAHVMWLIGTGFTDNPRELEKTSESVHYQLIFNGTMTMQLFFVISGFLTIYKLNISESLLITWRNIPKLLLLRWWRLTPANAIMIAFTATWLRYLGSGPLWNLYVMNVVSDCRRYWWTHMLYINNYHLANKACAVQTWHFATDLQLFSVGLIIYLFAKPRVRLSSLGLLLLVGMVAPVLHVWLQDLEAIVLMTPEFYRMFTSKTLRYLYFMGHNNLSSFVIGMITGHAAYQWQKRDVDFSKYKKYRPFLWCICPTIIGLLLTGRVFYTDGERASLTMRMAYTATHRAFLDVIMAVWILAMVFRIDVHSWVLEWDGWLVPSRLSYSANLLHVNIIHILLGMRTQLGHVSFFFVVINYLGVLTLSYLMALPFYLLVEAPMARIMKVALYNKFSLISKKNI